VKPTGKAARVAYAIATGPFRLVGETSVAVR